MSTNSNPLLGQIAAAIEAQGAELAQDQTALVAAQDKIAVDEGIIAGDAVTIASDAAALAKAQADLKAANDALAAANAALASHAPTVTIFNDLERTPWIVAPGTAANSGQTGSTADSAQSGPTATGCAFLSIAPSGPWADKYFYKQFGARPSKTHFEYEFAFMLPTAVDVAAANCIELDIQQCIGGVVFNTGLQFNFGGNSLRIWNRSLATLANTGGGDWEPTGQPSPRWPVGAWIVGSLETHRDASHVYYDAVTLSGIRFPLTQSFAAPNLAKPDMLNVAIQDDGNGQSTPFKLLLDAVRFSAW